MSFINRFCPTEAEKYNTFKIILLSTFLIPGLFKISSVIGANPFTYTLLLLLSLSNLLIGIYLYFKAKVIHYIIKLLIMYSVSFIVVILISALASDSGVGIVFLILGTLLSFVSIILLWKKRNILYSKYSTYIKYTVYPTILSLILMVIGFALLFTSLFSRSEFTAILSIIVLFLANALPFIGLWKILCIEQSKGTPFLVTFRNMNIIPLTYLLMIISVINLIPHHSVSADSMIDDVDTLTNDDSLITDDNNSNILVTEDTYDLNNNLTNNMISNQSSNDILFGKNVAIHELDSVGQYFNNTIDINNVSVPIKYDTNIFDQNEIILTSLNSDHINGQLLNSDGLQIFKFQDGAIFNSQNQHVYDYMFNESDKSFEIKDHLTNEVILTKDAQNNLYGNNGQEFIGHISDGNGAKTLYGIDGKIIGYTDVNGYMYTQSSKPLGSFKTA